jgi:uncharacterized protein
MYTRTLEHIIEKNINRQKVTMLLGARRVGKTDLLTKVYNKHKDKTLWLNGEDSIAEQLLEERSVANYSKLLQNYTVLIIDEAQYIPDISRKAKLMIDNIKPLHIILTGSSAFDLVQMGQPLTGRTITHLLYPLAQHEWQQNEDLKQTKENLESRLIFGSYPELSSFSLDTDKMKYLHELVNTYLLKDVLVFEQIKNAQLLKDLLVMLAHQVGSEVSVNELGKKLGVSKNTVDRYLDLLSKSFIIFQLGGYSNNLRKEVAKNKKWYFYDNGVRNALISNFQPLSIRNDVGALWEQYLIVERKKLLDYRGAIVQHYFWRTYDQQEIDLIEEENGKIKAFEFKWSNKSTKIPKAFANAYPAASFEVINSTNYHDWIYADFS